MQALNLSLTFFFLLGAYLLLMHSSEIVTTRIGATIRIGFLLFWIWRTIQQIVLFNLSKRVHQILLILFLLGVGLHSLAIWP